MKKKQPFMSQVEELAQPLVLKLAGDVQANLLEVINQAVHNYFHPLVAAALPQAQVPDGFRRLGAATAECWFALKPGNAMRGKLLGLFDRDDPRNKTTGRSEFFQVELLDPTECRYGKGEEATVKMASAGTVVNLNCNSKTEFLKDLIPVIKRHGEYEIFVRCNKKIDLNNGNTIWDMTVGEKLIKAPTVPEEIDFE